jgi:hypothetical protein
LEKVDMRRRKTSAKVACGGRVRNASSAERIEEMDVLAAEFDVLQAIAVAQGIVGEIEYVIRLMIREMNLEQMELAVDGIDQAKAPCQEVKGADAAMGDAVDTFGDFIMDVAGRKDGPSGVTEFGLGEQLKSRWKNGGSPGTIGRGRKLLPG